MKPILFVVLASLTLFSCVSSKKYKEAQARYDELNVKMTGDLNNCNTERTNVTKERDDLKAQNESLNSKVADLNKQIDYLKETNTTTLKQLQDLSVVLSSKAERKKKFWKILVRKTFTSRIFKKKWRERIL